MIKKTAIIEGKEYTLGASALLPRLYRQYFGRDLVVDMQKLSKAYNKAMTAGTEEERQAATFTVLDLEVFENVAWMMIRYAGGEIEDTPEEWLENMDGTFSIFDAMPTIIELWGSNNKTTSIPKKK